MQYSALGIFLSAFGGAMLLYVFRLAVEYRNDTENFVWGGWPDVYAQVGISLTITAITFLTLWKGIQTDPECNQAWYPYIKAGTEAMMLEMLIHMIGGHRDCRRRRQEKGNVGG